MDEALEEARLEWDFVEKNQEQNLANEQGDAGVSPLRYPEALKILQSNVANTKIDFPALTRPEDLGFFSRVYRRIFGPSFIQEKDRKDVSIFIKMASMGLDKIKSVEQMRLLSALYFNLIGRNPISRFGGHWVDIGFQGLIEKKSFSNLFL